MRGETSLEVRSFGSHVLPPWIEPEILSASYAFLSNEALKGVQLGQVMVLEEPVTLTPLPISFFLRQRMSGWGQCSVLGPEVGTQGEQTLGQD